MHARLSADGHRAKCRAECQWRSLPPAVLSARQGMVDVFIRSLPLVKRMSRPWGIALQLLDDSFSGSTSVGSPAPSTLNSSLHRRPHSASSGIPPYMQSSSMYHPRGPGAGLTHSLSDLGLTSALNGGGSSQHAPASSSSASSSLSRDRSAAPMPGMMSTFSGASPASEVLVQSLKNENELLKAQLSSLSQHDRELRKELDRARTSRNTFLEKVRDVRETTKVSCLRIYHVFLDGE